jgi:alanyl-tRNA synthetase
MLGNFSFGDYFKREAIAFAWELVTEVYGIEADRLWATVFRGDADVPGDEEAEAIWREEIGVPAERLGRYGRKDNFWQMGETGPAGPCSELHYDQGDGVGCGRAECDPACDCDRFLELWNLVFMQYELQPDGSRLPLPAPCVDTGAGLERFAAVLQGVTSNYETDLFRPLLDSVAGRAGLRYGEDPGRDVSLRVISDHLRAVTFLVTDGIIPGPEKRGSVLRRILRRAIRHGKALGLDRPFLSEHTAEVVEMMGGAYPELFESREVVREVTLREEEKFARTLSAGLDELEEILDGLAGAEDRTLPGEEMFRLESERGIPVDLVRDAVEERGFRADDEGYGKARARHAELSRAGAEGAAASSADPVYRELGLETTPFRGYGELVLEGVRVVALIRNGVQADRLGEGEEGEAILSETPFYAEAGGQVGDRGLLLGERLAVEVLDTRSPLPGLVSHRVRVLRGELRAGVEVKAEVDASARAATMKNHTATHLLHAALRELVGLHVKQRGSLVEPERLRFDFSHFAGLPPELLRDIEILVNEKVRDDLPVEPDEMPLEEALEAGAMALFGEKYGDRVRVLRIGDFSLELCGGTHVARTGEIGLFTVRGDRGISSGVRRVEGHTGSGALAELQEQRASLRQVEERIGGRGEALLEGLQRRIDRVRELEKENERLRLKLAQGGGGGSEEAPMTVAGIPVIARRVDGLGRGEARQLADALRHRHGSVVVILGREESGKAALLVAVTPDLKERLPAGAVVRELAGIVGGGGGGRPDLAEAGGRSPEKLDEALSRPTLERVLGSRTGSS